MYKVKITPIIPTYVVFVGRFETEEEAWQWVEEHNDPHVDYDVVEIDEGEGG